MDEFKETACRTIDDASADLQRISTEIWSNPELNFEEHHAHKILTEFLSDKGFDVTQNFVSDTGFKAVLGSRDYGPNIAVLCEYDALPEIGHACGHNLISEAGVAAALGIKSAFEKAGTPMGKLTVLGTPAEEGGGGKIDMIKAGVFDDVDVAMMVHPSPMNLAEVSAQGVDMVTVKYFGKASHAAAYPWVGVNALDAAVLCYQTVSCMRQQMKPEWRVHGVIHNGGVKPNIIPEYTELEFYFRALSKKDLDELREKMKGCFESAAVGTGCKVEYKFSEKPYLNLCTNKKMAKVYQKNAESFGVVFDRMEGTKGGSTDMGDVSHTVPSIHPYYRIEAHGVNHTKEFTVAAGDIKAQAPTLTQGKSMAMTCIDLYRSKELLTSIKAEFDEFIKNSA